MQLSPPSCHLLSLGSTFSPQPPEGLTLNALWEKTDYRSYLRCAAQRAFLRKNAYLSVVKGHQGQRGMQYAGR